MSAFAPLVGAKRGRASQIERMLAKAEAALAPPERKWLRAIVDDTDGEAVRKEKMEKALAEHVARHPEDVGRTLRTLTGYCG